MRGYLFRRHYLGVTYLVSIFTYCTTVVEHLQFFLLKKKKKHENLLKFVSIIETIFNTFASSIILIWKQDAALNPASPVLRLARAGETAWGPLPGDHWTVFRANSSTYEPVAWALREHDYGTTGE